MDTVPPPEGEDDAYSAATKVGIASAELLALVKQTEHSEPKLPIADEDAPPLSLTGAVIEDAPAPKKSIPPPVPKRSTAPPPPETRAHVHAAAAEAEAKGFSPALAIGLVLVAAAVVLAALVR